MPSSTPASASITDPEPILAALEAAEKAGKITPAACQNIRIWLTEARYAPYAPTVAEHVLSGKWKELDDVFWTVIPFGTGGRRGKMYPIGSNAINDRTIGESAQGLADYVKEAHAGGHLADAKLSCAIAYDTRHRSRHFAELCAEIFVAAGFKVHFLDGVRSTPELSVAVRQTHSACGLMITASHNPPSDNAVKAYWSTGGQLLPPHDTGVIERVMQVTTIDRVPFATALADGRIEYCQEAIDRAYQSAVESQSRPGPRDLKILYTPLHGVGATAVLPVLAAVGFRNVELFGPQSTPDGDFPNVPGHVANPENPPVFDAPIEFAKTSGHELILATDPDADRLGAAAPLVLNGKEWGTFTGNQIGALLTEHVLATRSKGGGLLSDHFLAKTLVTTEMIRRIGDAYGVKTVGNLLVGFKWIGGLIDELGPERFILGTEESHGYLVGTHARDKDAAVAALLLAELAASCKAAGQSLHEKLDALYWQYGCHAEKTVSKTMPGSAGMARMQSLMGKLRSEPFKSLAGMPVRQIRDYERGVVRDAGGKETPLAGPVGDLIIFDLEPEGNYAAIRPSGTEPKVKFYLFAYEPAEMLANLDDTKAELAARLAAFERELGAYADAVA